MNVVNDSQRRFWGVVSFPNSFSNGPASQYLNFMKGELGREDLKRFKHIDDSVAPHCGFCKKGESFE
jgi:hypothetical protein